MSFPVQVDNHRVTMNTKPALGADTALSHKIVIGIGTRDCTKMNVVAFSKKYKEPLKSLQLEAEATLSAKVYPEILKKDRLYAQLQGLLESEKEMKGVTLSQANYCNVSAMISKSVPIFYTAEFNVKSIGSGRADFKS